MSSEPNLSQLAHVYGISRPAIEKIEKRCPLGRLTTSNPDALFFHLLTRSSGKLRQRLVDPEFRQRAKAEIDLLSIRGDAPSTENKTDSIQ